MKFDWTNYCATNLNRNQCCKEYCKYFPICKIKELIAQDNKELPKKKNSIVKPTAQKRQGLIVTLNQLHNLIEELEEEFEWEGACRVTDDDRKFQINIINREGLSDTWKIESQHPEVNSLSGGGGNK